MENAFGILSNRWRFLFTPVDAKPEKLMIVLHASCVLHNLLCTVSDNDYNPPGYADTHTPTGELVDGFWRTEQQVLSRLAIHPARNHTVAAAGVRESLVNWCSAEGAREWQDRFILRVE